MPRRPPRAGTDVAAAQIIGYGIRFDEAGRVLLLRRRESAPPWPGRWWLPGDVTPADEEPDDTVPRVFRDLLRQRASTAYLATVTGEDPQSGRHTVHNAYLVTGADALDPQPEDEANPFDAMEWHGSEAALAELPREQAALLRAALEQAELGIAPGPAPTLDEVFEEPAGAAMELLQRPEGLSPREMALVEYAYLLGASGPLDAVEEAMFEVLSEGVPKGEVERMRAYFEGLYAHLPKSGSGAGGGGPLPTMPPGAEPGGPDGGAR